MQAPRIVSVLALVTLVLAAAGPLARGADAGKHPRYIRLRVPFTPTNPDGSVGKTVVVTIKIEAGSREKAVAAAEEVIDRLLVSPRLDEQWDEFNEQLEQAIKANSGEAIPPPAPPEAPNPTQLEVQDQPAGRSVEIEITGRGLLQAVDQAAGYPSIPTLLRVLGLRFLAERASGRAY